MQHSLIQNVIVTVCCATACAAPADMAGKMVVVSVNGAQQAHTEFAEPPTQWSICLSTPLVLQFPAKCANRFTYQLYESTPDSPWPPVEVVYSAQDSAIRLTGNDMSAEVKLTFTSDTEGRAEITWFEETGAWYVRGAAFHICSSSSSAGLIILPEAETTDGAIQTVDDGLGELIRGLETTQYQTAVERLYQKRLLTILPQMMEGGDVNNVLSDANGTTALHNACGLSHVEIVQWLVDHGADLSAKTAKGASVDDCVGGKNAKLIRTILREARNKKQGSKSVNPSPVQK